MSGGLLSGNSPSIVQLVATGLFAVAVLHTFSTRYFEHLAHAQPNHAGVWHLLGEVETVFGFWAMALLVPLGIALNGTSSVLYGTVAEFVREDRQSRSFGLFYTLGSAAGASAPLIFGAVSDLAGVSPALLVLAGLAIVTVPIALALDPHLAKRDLAATPG